MNLDFSFSKKLSTQISRNATNQKFAKIAKITAVLTGGYYDVEDSTGTPITRVVTVGANLKYYVGQWVTLEYFGGDWAIAGVSAHKGGD